MLWTDFPEHSGCGHEGEKERLELRDCYGRSTLFDSYNVYYFVIMTLTLWQWPSSIMWVRPDFALCWISSMSWSVWNLWSKLRTVPLSVGRLLLLLHPCAVTSFYGHMNGYTEADVGDRWYIQEGCCLLMLHSHIGKYNFPLLLDSKNTKVSYLGSSIKVNQQLLIKFIAVCVTCCILPKKILMRGNSQGQ